MEAEGEGAAAAEQPGATAALDGAIAALQSVLKAVAALPRDVRQALEAPMDLPPRPYLDELLALSSCRLPPGKGVPRDHALVGCRVVCNLPLAASFIGELVQDVAAAAAAHAAGGPRSAPPPNMPDWGAVEDAGLARMLSMLAQLVGAGVSDLTPLPCALLDAAVGPLMEAARATPPFGRIGFIVLRTAVQRLPSQDAEQTNIIARGHSALAEALYQQLGVRFVCIEADLGYGHHFGADFPDWLLKAAATMLDVAVLGLQAATLQVLRVDACDTALQHLGASISTRDIHAAASQLRARAPFGLPVACPGTHLMRTITPDKVLEPQDWAGCLQALVAGAASISVSATQLCEPAANEARHCQVFAALVAPLLELQREQQAKPSAHWRFALPDAPAYSAEVLFHLLRCNDPAAYDQMGAMLAAAAEAAAGPPPEPPPPPTGPFQKQPVRAEEQLWFGCDVEATVLAEPSDWTLNDAVQQAIAAAQQEAVAAHPWVSAASTQQPQQQQPGCPAGAAAQGAAGEAEPLQQQQQPGSSAGAAAQGAAGEAEPLQPEPQQPGSSAAPAASAHAMNIEAPAAPSAAATAAANEAAVAQHHGSLLSRLGQLALQAAAAGNSSLRIQQGPASSLQLLTTDRSRREGGAALLRRAAAVLTRSTKKKGGSLDEPLTLRKLLEHAARLMEDPGSAATLPLPLSRFDARELRRQLRAAGRDIVQAGWSEERRAADRAARGAAQQAAAAERATAKAAAARHRMRHAQAVLQHHSALIVSFTGAGGNPYSRLPPEAWRPQGINLMINFVQPGWFGDAMGPHHTWMQDYAPIP